MAQTATSRFALPQWSAGTDSYPGRTGFNLFLKLLEDKAAMAYPSGLLQNRPTSGWFGRFYFATDQGTTGMLYYDHGAGWIELGSVGGGGAGQPITITGTASEGNSSRAARADHSHRMSLATAGAHGAMASQDKEMLDAATSLVVNNAIVKRTSSGHVFLPQFGQGNYDAIHKKYVDDATASLSNASGGNTPGALVLRGSDANFLVPSNPSHGNHPTPKNYVDGKTWDAGRITSGALGYARVEGSRHAYYTAWNGSGSIRTVNATSSGEFCYYSSTERHKTNITPWGVDPRSVFAVIPVEFDRLDPTTGEPTGVHDYGVRAEQAGKHLPMYLQHGDDGRIEGWSYQQWTTALQVGLRDLDQRDHEKDRTIAGLRRDNEALSKRIGRLEDHLGV